MSIQSQKLASDLKVLVQDAEELLKATAAQTGDKVIELRHRVQQTVADVRPQITQLETAAVEKVKSAASATDNYVHQHPWTAMGTVACLGMVIGLLIGRR